MSVSISPDVARTRSRLGVAARRGDPHEVEEARRDFAEARIAAAIEQTVATFPRLTDAQCARLARLLRAGAA